MICPYCDGKGEVGQVEPKDSFRRKLRLIFCESGSDAKHVLAKYQGEGSSVNWVSRIAVDKDWAVHIYAFSPTEKLRRYSDVDEIIFYISPTDAELFTAKGKVLPDGEVYIREFDCEFNNN